MVIILRKRRYSDTSGEGENYNKCNQILTSLKCPLTQINIPAIYAWLLLALKK